MISLLPAFGIAFIVFVAWLLDWHERHPVKCPRCGTLYRVDRDRCGGCGAP